ncbi:Membrane-associated protein gex-3, partial [Dissostichus eleginoides]
KVKGAMTQLSIKRKTKATPSSSKGVHAICQATHRIPQGCPSGLGTAGGSAPREHKSDEEEEELLNPEQAAKSQY